MSTQSVLDFSGVKAAESNYLKPGQYLMRITDVKLDKSSRKGTPFLQLTFETKEGKKLNHDFYLSDKSKTLERFQYVFEGFTGAPLSQAFSSYEEAAQIVKAALVKSPFKPVQVSARQIPDGRVFNDLAYVGFMLPKKDFIEKEYEIGSAEYKSILKIEAPSQEVANTNNAILPTTEMWTAADI